MISKVAICAYDSIHCHGGPHVWISRFPAALSKKGIKVRVNLLCWDNPEKGFAYQAIRRDMVDVRSTGFSDTATNVRWLLEQIAEDPPDAVLANNVLAAFFATRYLRQAGIPNIGIIRSDADFYNAITKRFAKAAGPNRLSGITFVSKFLRQQFLDTCPDLPTRFIPSGTIVPAARTEMPRETLRVAYVGRLVEDAKRISLVTRAFDRLTAEIEGVEATIYGDGPERRNVETILAASKTSRVRLAGYLPNKELRRELMNSHVIVLLSDFEGSPMAVMEGMACGCVPVCLNIRSGIPDLVEDGVTGLLVEDRAEGFIKAIRRLRNDQCLWQRLSKAAREKIVAEFSLDACVETWSQFFQAVCEDSREQHRLIIPDKVQLPKFDPVFASEDHRLPSMGARIADRVSDTVVRARMSLGKFRRKLIASPAGNDSEEPES